ncbi:DUF4085 family protein [Fredinandcohnia sp. QZ13]|uniref:DUF4085 family protein n=1 Tax=Fredinandcohnia sp. QZ13 TaxID=3073144 RepID=UPI002853250C|nr:DUF4085 family protein [Fredinandcohnia sp. QZ13]MDR4887707.1 DUF4085 family protein [Fredinandcohnia sp. QZ13]
MWNLTKQAKEKFSTCNTLPIHESEEEWEFSLRDAKEEGEDLISRLKEELEEVKGVLLQTLPDRFLPYVKNGTLNQPTLPKSVRDDYLQWMHEADKEFEHILDAAHEQTANAVTFLSKEVQDVFEESLHDSTIERIEREGDTLHLYINTDGGFSSKALIQFTFENVMAEEFEVPLEVGHWIVYYELQKTNDGFAFRVLFECPDSEWTISMRNLEACYYYRPALYTLLHHEEKLEETPFEEYIAQLNPDDHHWLHTPHVTCAFQSIAEPITLENGKLEVTQNEMIVTVENKSFTYDLEEVNPIQFIYTDVYEDPYAHLDEPLPMDEIEEAALCDNLELQVRAWNTMYANPLELAEIINRVLTKMTITEENEMMASVYANHFYNEGILTKDVIEKYRSLID